MVRAMREQELAYFRYFVTEKGLAAQDKAAFGSEPADGLHYGREFSDRAAP